MNRISAAVRHERDSKILEQMERVGLDYGALARRTRIHKETIRYLYGRRMHERSIVLRPMIAHERLGLYYIHFLVELGPEFREKKGGLLWESRTPAYPCGEFAVLPSNLRLISHLAPETEHTSICASYEELQRTGHCEVIETYRATRLRYSPMWRDGYRVESGEWDPDASSFDWQTIAPPAGETCTMQHLPQNVDDLVPPRRLAKFDEIDLRILGEIDFDPGQSLVLVAKRLGISHSAIFYHWREHILQRRLLDGWRVDWPRGMRSVRTQYPRSASGERPSATTGKNACCFVSHDLVAKRLSPVELMGLRAKLHSIPYLCCEYIGDADYVAEVYLPFAELISGFRFLSRLVNWLGVERANVLVVEHPCAPPRVAGLGRTAAIHPELYDASTKWWTSAAPRGPQGI